MYELEPIFSTACHHKTSKNVIICENSDQMHYRQKQNKECH